MRAVRLPAAMLGRIPQRDWGTPTLVEPGKLWRARDDLIVCTLPSGRDAVRFDTRRLKVVTERPWLPKTWRRAIWGYVERWPASGSEHGVFALATEARRAALLRKLARELTQAPSDRAERIARMMGAIAEDRFDLWGEW